MKSLLNWFFGSKPEVQKIVPVIEPKKEPELVVGEPVISFVALVKANPKRFKMRQHLEFIDRTLFEKRLITDKETKETFWYRKDQYESMWVMRTEVRRYTYTGNPSFLTQDEWEYVELQLGTSYNRETAIRYSSIRTAKADRLARETRQRLMDIYCTK